METQTFLDAIQRSVQVDEPKGIAGLVQSIHRVPELRDWVTLESIVLAPAPSRIANQWTLVSLLTRPVSLPEGKFGITLPWGAIRWDAFSGRLLEKIPLSLPDTSDSKLCGVMPLTSANAKVVAERRLREKMLFERLDAIFASNMEAALPDDLAAYYSGLLPAEVYPFYWGVIPESKEWLLPNTPMITIHQAMEPVVQSGTTTALNRLGAINSTGLGLPVEEPVVANDPLTPIDLSDRISGWSNRIAALAGELQATSILESLKELKQYQTAPSFRMAIVGEFNTGKSTLLNRLLNRQILPAGVLPTTAIPTLISYQPREEIILTFANGKQDIRPLTLQSWDQLVAQHDDEQKFINTTARVMVDHPWLLALRAELVDTPGAGDLVGYRARLVADLVSRCDAAVMVISATKPMSLTEVSFLEDHIVKQHVPRILIVVTKFDEIEMDKRRQQFTYIQARIAAIAPGVTVLPTFGIGAGSDDEQALEAIRVQITKMADQSQRGAWRSHQVAGTLLDNARGLTQLSQTAAETARLTVEERRQAITKEQGVIKSNELIWDQILLELDERRMRNIEVIRTRLEQSRGEIIEGLQYELQRTNDPKSWWERDLPYRLRREMITIGRRMEDLLIKTVATDNEWLRQLIRERFQEETITAPISTQELDEIRPNSGKLEVADLNRYRLLSRIGLGLTSVVSLLLLGPIAGALSVGAVGAIGIAVSTGGGVANEIWLKKRVGEQQKLLSGEVAGVVSRSIDEICGAITERMQNLYAGIVEEQRKTQNRWHSAKMKALESGSNGPVINITHLEDIVQQAKVCAQEIAAVLPVSQ